MFIDHVEGRYPVGATTFSLPIRPTRQFGTSELKAGGLNPPGPAVVLSEIAFSIYYPTLPDGSEQGIDWQIRPIHHALLGESHRLDISYWKLFPLFYFCRSQLKIPVYDRVPVLDPPDGQKTWPVVFFFHGLSGTRNSSSHICARLASSGKVVIIMEHRDGSSIACYPKTPETGIPTPKYYIHPTDTIAGEAGQFQLRLDQLDLRRFEIYQTYRVLKELVVNGSCDGLELINGGVIDWNFLRDKVTLDHIQICGYSFGGSTVFSLLSNPPPPGFEQLPITHALLQDPWLEMFPSPGPSLHPNHRKVKMAIINSERFTLWRAHFTRLRGVAKDWNNTPIYTVLRSVHEHFSDRHIVDPINLLSGSSSMASKHLRVIGDMTNAFLDDRMDECLSRYPTRGMVFERSKATWLEKADGQLEGEFGDIVVHDYAPTTPGKRVASARL